MSEMMCRESHSVNSTAWASMVTWSVSQYGPTNSKLACRSRLRLD